MKKIKMWILVITFALTLAGCGKAESETHRPVDSQETTEMLETSVPAPTGYASSVQGEIKQASPTSLKLKLTNSGNETISYGDAYTLEVFQQDTWESLPVLLENYGFHEVLYELKPEESQLLDIEFEWLYGILSPGHYRIVKEMFQANGKAFLVSADFDISFPGAYPPCVMIDGILYKDTGYISSMAGCGTMDGEIASAVPGTKLPSENDQSNFGSGYAYQRSSEGQVIVMIDDQPVIFRDMEKSETGIPAEVIHFTGEVREITDSGELLITHINTAEGFQMDGGDYYVSTENMRDEVFVGDVVEVWFDGTIKETDPLQLGRVYRVEKVE